METVCKLVNVKFLEGLPVIIGFIFLIFWLVVIICFFRKQYIRGWKLIFIIPASIIFLLILTLNLFISGFMFTETLGNPIASTYFAVNGEVKLACLYSGPSNPRVCPKNKDQVLDLSPEFGHLLSGKEWDYKYYPNQNEYTLIIKHDWFRGAIFDPLLAKLGHMDLVETNYDCAGNINAYPVKKTIWENYRQMRMEALPILKSSSSQSL